MPDLATRFRHEQEFGYGYFLALNRQRDKLLRYGVDRLGTRPDDAWKQDEDELAAAMLLLLYRPYAEAEGQLLGMNGTIVRPSDRSDAFRLWATDYARTTAKGIVDTTRTIAQRDAVTINAGRSGAFPTDPTKVRELRRALTLEDVVSKDRIDRTAITETTQAITAGEQAAATQITVATGVKLKPYWVTAEDDGVCSFCRRNHDRSCQLGDVGFPPQHVRCRCFADWRPF